MRRHERSERSDPDHPTPFDSEGRVDEDSIVSLVEFEAHAACTVSTSWASWASSTSSPSPSAGAWPRSSSRARPGDSRSSSAPPTPGPAPASSLAGRGGGRRRRPHGGAAAGSPGRWRDPRALPRGSGSGLGAHRRPGRAGHDRVIMSPKQDRTLTAPRQQRHVSLSRRRLSAVIAILRFAANTVVPNGRHASGRSHGRSSGREERTGRRHVGGLHQPATA